MQSTRMRSAILFWLWPALFLIAGSGMLRGQQPFPAGTPGEIYYCPRIDLNPAKDGGPLTIVLDGALDEPAWKRAAFHGPTEYWKGGAALVDELDCDPKWAAVADENFLYVAWRIVDESRQAQSLGCQAWNDDAVELYFDGLGDGPGCAACGYGVDDMQLIVGVDNLGAGDPALLAAGMIRAGPGCILTGPAEDVFQGVIADLDSEDALSGWQGEIAIALENPREPPDGGQWSVQPTHGTVIGWDVHFDDDDTGGGQDATTSALIWSKNDPNSRAWQTPGVWGKLQFITPDKPLATVSRDLPEALRNGTSGTVSLKVTPVFGVGVVKINEELPAGLTPANPSHGGTIAQNAVTWDLGLVNAEVVVTYTLTAGPEVIDILLPGTASIDGEKLKIGGDTTYTGSPFSTLGFIKLWNHLGPLGSGLPAGTTCDPGPDLALDWIVNEGATVTEANISPFPGMLTRPKYGGDGLAGGTGARSTGLKLKDGRVTTDRFPIWKTGLSPSSTIDHASPQVNGFDADDHVTLSSVYVTNHTRVPIATQIGLGSDDSIQVYLGTEPLEPVNICRGWGGTDEEQSLIPVVLPVGESRILVKVADGTGASGFRLRFQDPGDPLSPGLLPPEITASLESAVNPPPALVTRELSRETFGLDEVVEVALKIATRPNTSIVLREIVPAPASARDISDGGVLTGDTIEWNLSGVSQRTVTYKLAPASCAGGLSFGQSTWKVGSIEALITGQSTLSRVPPAEGVFAASWKSLDIGYTGGVARPVGEHEALVVGLGQGIKLTEDQFRFVFLNATGDFEVSARIDCMDDPGGAGVGGLMVRDTLDPFSAHAFVGLSSSSTAGRAGTLRGIFRRETSANRSSSQISITQRDVLALPIYLKLKRSGPRISFERSGDGAAWTEVAQREIGTGSTQLNLQSTTLVGLAVSGGGDGATGFTFGAVSGPGFTTIDVEPKFRRGDADSSGLLDLSDAIKLLGFLFLGGEKPECLDAADIDDNGLADISDAIANLTYQFLGGTAPAEPGPTVCGPDPRKEEPELGCDKPCA